MSRVQKILIATACIALGAFLIWKIVPGGHEIATESFEESPEVVKNERTQGAMMLFVGDIMLGRNVGERTARTGDWRYPFLRIAGTLREADLTFGNLEGPISSRGVKVGSIYSFRFDPRVTEALQHAGFDIVSLANNHIWDYGREAFSDTRTHLANAGIVAVGVGDTFFDAHAGKVIDVAGARVVFLAYSNLMPRGIEATSSRAGVTLFDRTQIQKDIQAAMLKGDIVVVSFHMGDEYQTAHNALQEAVYREAIDAGADLIVGHHPHVSQELEQYKDGWIAYSLGNFVFDQDFSEETMRGLMLKARIKNKKLVSVETVPVRISPDFQPYLE